MNVDQDLDVTCFRNASSSFETGYFSPNEIGGQFNDFTEECISVLHLNIRSMTKNKKYDEKLRIFSRTLQLQV